MRPSKVYFIYFTKTRVGALFVPSANSMGEQNVSGTILMGTFFVLFFCRKHLLDFNKENKHKHE